MERAHWRRGSVLGGIALLVVLALAGCSSTSATKSGTTTTPAVAAGTTTTSGAAGSTSTTVPSSTAVNVAITDQLRAELVAAGASLGNIPVSEYSGLRSGLTYYAYDRSTQTYWAGAQLVPAPSSDPSNPTQAQVASQDDGSYYIFTQSQGGAWRAHASGASGEDSPCPIAVPAAVTTVWGWPSGSCRPTNI